MAKTMASHLHASQCSRSLTLILTPSIRGSNVVRYYRICKDGRFAKLKKEDRAGGGGNMTRNIGIRLYCWL
jgi:hypothetical protein